MLKVLGGLTIALVAFSGCAVQPDTSPISLEERFYEVAFYDENRSVEDTFKRWELPFSTYANGATPEERMFIEEMLDQISAASGLPAELNRDPRSNIRIFILDKADWTARLEKEREWRAKNGLSPSYSPICYVHPYVDGDGKPFLEVGIPKFISSALRKKCLAQELSHTTGLRFDTDGRSDTVFGDYEGAYGLTAIDLDLLRIHYDPRLKPGMTWAEAQPIVRQIIEEL